MESPLLEMSQKGVDFVIWFNGHGVKILQSMILDLFSNLNGSVIQFFYRTGLKKIEVESS